MKTLDERYKLRKAVERKGWRVLGWTARYYLVAEDHEYTTYITADGETWTAYEAELDGDYQ